PSFSSPSLGAGNRCQFPLRRESLLMSRSLPFKILQLHSRSRRDRIMSQLHSSSSIRITNRSYSINNSHNDNSLGQHSLRVSTMLFLLLPALEDQDPNVRHTLLCLRHWKTSLQR